MNCKSLNTKIDEIKDVLEEVAKSALSVTQRFGDNNPIAAAMAFGIMTRELEQLAVKFYEMQEVINNEE